MPVALLPPGRLLRPYSASARSAPAISCCGGTVSDSRKRTRAVALQAEDGVDGGRTQRRARRHARHARSSAARCARRRPRRAGSLDVHQNCTCAQVRAEAEVEAVGEAAAEPDEAEAVAEHRGLAPRRTDLQLRAASLRWAATHVRCRRGGVLRRHMSLRSSITLELSAREVQRGYPPPPPDGRLIDCAQSWPAAGRPQQVCRPWAPCVEHLRRNHHTVRSLGCRLPGLRPRRRRRHR